MDLFNYTFTATEQQNFVIAKKVIFSIENICRHRLRLKKGSLFYDGENRTHKQWTVNWLWQEGCKLGIPGCRIVKVSHFGIKNQTSIFQSGRVVYLVLYRSLLTQHISYTPTHRMGANRVVYFTLNSWCVHQTDAMMQMIDIQFSGQLPQVLDYELYATKMTHHTKNKKYFISHKLAWLIIMNYAHDYGVNRLNWISFPI